MLVMQTTFLQDASSNSYIITAYTHHGISINGILYTGDILLTPTQLIQHQPLPTEATNIPAWLAQLNTPPEVIILGTGEKTQFLPPNIQHVFLQAHIGVETMTNAAACRTYNVLAHEDRKVALVLSLS